MKTLCISIVIPVYNEAESILPLVSELDTIARITHKTFEYIFVDDGSTDGTFEKLKSLKKKTSAPIIIIRFRKNMGKSAALSVGLSHANSDIIVTMDADLQDDPGQIPVLLQALSDGVDMVVGWRKNRRDAQSKILKSKLFNSIVSNLYGLSLHDINCGLKVMRKAVAGELDIYGELHRFIPVLAKQKGFNVAEAPVSHRPRIHGMSKFGDGRIIHAFFDLAATAFLTSFKTRPLQMFGTIGMAFIGIGIVILTYLSYIHFLGERIGNRPLLLLGALLVLFGVQMFSTGLLAELLTSINAKKHTYPIAEIIH